MSLGKMAVTGMLGFAVGASLMMMPSNQKMKRKVMSKVDQMAKIAKAW